MSTLLLPEDQAFETACAARRRPTVRVLHVINGEHYAGAERVQDLLALHLPADGFAVDFCCLKSGAFAAARRATQSRLIELPMAARFDLRAAWRLGSLARSGGYEILHSHTPRSLLVASVAAWLSGVPLVHHLHSPTTRDTTHPWRCRINAWVERVAIRRARAVFTVSESLRAHARELGVTTARVHVVPNGVPCNDAASQWRRPATDGRWTLGTVALFRPRKGIEVLLRAVAALRGEGRPVILRAVGGFESSEYRREVHRLADELQLGDAVQWIGFTRDVAAELRRMDLFVLPSLFGEGMPMVVLEAMAAGVPVVATQVEGVPEVIRDGQEGLLVQPNDSESLAAAVSSVIAGRYDWQSLRTAAIARHREHFSAERMAHAVAEVYRVVYPRPPAAVAATLSPRKGEG